MNKKYEKNLSRQRIIREKIRELQSDLQELKEEQEEMENVEILKGYRSTGISLDEFLEMVKNHKKEEIKERKDGENMEKSYNHQNIIYDNNKNVETEEKTNEENEK